MHSFVYGLLCFTLFLRYPSILICVVFIHLILLLDSILLLHTVPILQYKRYFVLFLLEKSRQSHRKIGKILGHFIKEGFEMTNKHMKACHHYFHHKNVSKNHKMLPLSTHHKEQEEKVRKQQVLLSMWDNWINCCNHLKTTWQYLTKKNIQMQPDPEIPPLGICLTYIR